MPQQKELRRVAQGSADFRTITASAGQARRLLSFFLCDLRLKTRKERIVINKKTRNIIIAVAVLLVLVIGAILIYNAAKPAAQEGGKNIVVTIVHGDGSSKEVNISTDAETLRAALEEKFPNVRGNIKFIQTGPPADYPVMMRVSGYDKDKVREIANGVADIMREDPNYTEINFDWNEKAKAVRLTLNQEKLKSLGASSAAVAQTLYTELTGARIAQYYRDDRTIDIELRIAEKDRRDLSSLGDLPVYLATGTVPLSQVAEISFTAEDGLIWRRDLMPTITVQANNQKGTADDAAKKVYDKTAELRKNLPFGFSITAGGSMDDSAKSM